MPPIEASISWWDIIARMEGLFGPVQHDPLPLGNKADAIDELVYILLTLMTRSQPRIDRAYDGLQQLAPDAWSQLLDRDMDEITAVLRPLGFAKRRTDQLLGMLEEPLISSADASHQLAALDDDELLEALTSLPGIGVKSAKCVMMYSLDRQVLPVDVHVARVARRLGYLPDGRTLLQADRQLEPQVPPELRFDVHVQLVRHGRAVCQQPTPRCVSCLLADVCPSCLA